MIEIMCKDGYGDLHHAGVLAVDVPRFKSMQRAEKWCAQQGWRGKGRDGTRYEICIHEAAQGRGGTT